MIPGKDALSAINQCLQDKYSVSVTQTAIIDAMSVDEIPAEMIVLVRILAKFASSHVAHEGREEE